MDKTAIAQLMGERGRLYSWATKVHNKLELTAEDKDISKEIGAWAKSIGERGIDINGSFAKYIQSVVQPELDASRDALISTLFNEGQIGEFDTKEYTEMPKNTLKAYNAAKSGNVDKSYLDLKKATTKIGRKQVEFEIPYIEFRKPDSFKTVAQYTMYAEEALKNELFSDIFNMLDKEIVGITAGSPNLTIVKMDELTLHLIDRMVSGDEGILVTLNKFAQKIARMEDYDKYMSDAMKNEFNRYGMAVSYGGFKVAGISGVKKASDGKLVIPDNTIYAFGGKVGNIDMRGEIRVYETPDNNREVLNVKVTGFDYQFSITYKDKVQKLKLS